jgi:hypothetical protein
VPLANVNKAHQANQLYPFAISLSESVGTYDQTLKKVCFQLFGGWVRLGVDEKIHLLQKYFVDLVFFV